MQLVGSHGLWQTDLSAMQQSTLASVDTQYFQRGGTAQAQILQPLRGDGLNPFHIQEHRSFYRNINFMNGCAQVVSDCLRPQCSIYMGF